MGAFSYLCLRILKYITVAVVAESWPESGKVLQDTLVWHRTRIDKIVEVDTSLRGLVMHERELDSSLVTENNHRAL